MSGDGSSAGELVDLSYRLYARYFVLFVFCTVTFWRRQLARCVRVSLGEYVQWNTEKTGEKNRKLTTQRTRYCSPFCEFWLGNKCDFDTTSIFDRRRKLYQTTGTRGIIRIHTYVLLVAQTDSRSGYDEGSFGPSQFQYG